MGRTSRFALTHDRAGDMLVCESGVELRPLWPWDVPRIAALPCHPSDAWCVAIAESLDAPLLTRNPALAELRASCRIEIY
jgi:hypothetical protein